MNFKETMDYMYNLLPMYQRVGKSAFKKDLSNTYELCALLGNPQSRFKTVHIAGTNGKGSSAHMLASIMQTAGYKTGLYTSPHLKSFTERIKINGHEMGESYVIEFIEKLKHAIEEIQPSFFEITVVMAFDYFAKQNVDVAIIEVGLGGRFDSTNVVNPVISLITSIGLDHTDMLGETLPEIAFEKAGIIKAGIPVVIGETQEKTTSVFKKKAAEMHAPIYFADQEYSVSLVDKPSAKLCFQVKVFDHMLQAETDTTGRYQLKNISGVMKVLELLKGNGFSINDDDLKKGFRNVVKNTGLLGRWQTLGYNPLIICDTAHNEDGVKYVVDQINEMSFNKLHIIWGAVDGKDLDKIFQLLPKDAFYYFCEASIPRAMKAEKVKEFAMKNEIHGVIIHDVNEAIKRARNTSTKEDLIIIGGSNFIVSEITNLTV